MVFLLDQYILLSLGFQITTMRTPVYHSTAMRIIAVLAPIPTAMIIAAALDIDLVAVIGVAISVAIIWLFFSQQPGYWKKIGLTSPNSLWRTALVSVVLACLLHLLLSLLTPLVLSLTGDGLDLSHFESIRGNLLALLISLGVVWTTAAVGEEIIFRGFFLNEVVAMLGAWRGKPIIALLLSSALFGLAHAYQGWTGVILTSFAGLFFGSLYLIFRKSLWVPILTHGIFDTIAFVALYLSLDRGV